VADAVPIYAPETPATGGEEPPLLRKARQGLEAARLLIGQGCAGPALDLLLGSLLAAAAQRAGRTDAPSPSEAGIWLFGEILPAGLLEQQDAGLLMRALALTQGADAVPEPMLTALADDAAVFVGGIAG
jgi:hypothetical protein